MKFAARAVLFPVLFSLILAPASRASAFSDDRLVDEGISDQPLELVNVESVRILGRGVVDKETSDSIALICVSELCEQVRFGVYRQAKSTWTLVGATLNVPKAPTDRLKKKALKVMMSRFFATHSTTGFDNQMTNAKNWHMIMGFVLMMAVVAGIMATDPAAVDSNTLLPAASLCLSFFLVKTEALGMVNALAGAGFSFNEVTYSDQKGWNWAGNAKRISHKKFTIIADLVSVDSENRSLPAKISEKIGVLQTKGVQF